jgi:hypothetical protein
MYCSKYNIMYGINLNYVYNIMYDIKKIIFK